MSDYARLIEIFDHLIAFRTVTGEPIPAAKCLNYAEKILDTAGLRIDRYSSNGFESIVATTRGTKRPKLLLQAHLDVVPAAKEHFKLTRDGTKLKGRGVFDMKYAAACYLLLIEELGTRCEDYDLGVMLTTDEEMTGQNGVRYLLEQGYGCEICVLPDGGDNWRLETAAKGDWIAGITAHGRSAHGSRPWDGDNAAMKLLRFLSEAESLCPVTNHTDTTLVVSTMKSGSAWNQVPDTAQASLDIRYMNPAALADIQQRLAALAEKHDVELETLSLIDATELDVSLPAVQEWVRVVSQKRGMDAANGYALSFGASDARFFAAKGIPAIVTRPDGGGMHGEDEWIDEAGLYEFYECLQLYVESVACGGLDETAATGYTEAKLPETVTEI